MATFTVAFKDALERDDTIKSEILANYPIWDEEYRPWLNEQIIDQFWNREIGQESISLFKLALKRKLNQIMPLYNQHYLASQLKIDPLQTMRIKNVVRSVGEGRTASSSDSTSDSDSTAKAIATDYPHTARTEEGSYASSGQENESASKARGTAAEESTRSQEDTRDGETVGSTGHAAMLLFQYRQTLVNVDTMVLNDLEDLFFLLFDNGDAYTKHNYGIGYGRYGL